MKRPTITPEIVREAAAELVGASPGVAGDDPEQAVRDIVDCYNFRMDGYQLGRALESFGWDMDFDLASELDGLDQHVRSALKKAEKAWAADNNIQPPYPIGAATTKGTITGLSEHSAACYEIKPFGQDDSATGTRRLIVRFEDAVLHDPLEARA